MPELQLLRASHAPAVLAFELANRAYFAAFISDRGDEYFDQFAEQHRARLAEQEAGAGAYYVLAAEDGSVLGRFNLIFAGDGTAELGYRVAQHVAGRGLATATVRELCQLAATRHGLRRLRAGTSLQNVASQKVLVKAGFVPVGPADPAHLGGKPGTWYERDLEPLRYDLEREAVRVVLADESDHVLLFHVETVDVPGGWWELPGGGIEPGESYLEAAIREIREETGLVLDPARIGPPAWRRDSTWLSRGKRRLQHEVVVLAHVAAEQPAIVDGGRTPAEIEDYVAARWWRVPEITQSQQRFYPGRLPDLLPRFLAGEDIDEPFEYWN